MSLAQAFQAVEQFEDLRNVAGQRGYAVLDMDGTIIQSSGELNTSVEGSKEKVDNIYCMLQDVRGVLQKDKFKKLEVRDDDVSFLVTMSTAHIFVLKMDVTD
ncbi:ragulator complex protein LAMTOR [Acrasis kona]|uniref:Ragulator complex protein LAMTOR n=1 Tax=Acrasis kona TaxID=1008807 RepID=A0AAW2Z588_9EUKA